jgi:hypothetical protein
MRSSRAFLSGIIDYAGLFPPASVDMQTAVTSYAKYRTGDDRDLLGRFVVPASRLDEFADCLRRVSDSNGDLAPWRLSAIVKDNPAEAAETILSFNDRMRPVQETLRAICDSVELPVAAETEVLEAAKLFRESFRLFLEVRTDENPVPLLDAIRHHHVLAKMRTGGITETAFPSSREVVAFIAACNSLGVPFKATAGLHHALRSVYPLTYERDSPCGMMFGFLNVFLAAAFIRDGMSQDDAQCVLDEQTPEAFTFDDRGVSWRGRKVSYSELNATRTQLALSFGSCSFVEPVEEARSLGLL